MVSCSLVTNPVIEHFIAKFRDARTSTYDCILCVENISFFLAGEVSKHLLRKNVSIQTPLGVKVCSVIAEDIVLIPVLRAGLSMLSSFQRMFPDCNTGFMWAHRDHNGCAIVDKYKIPVALLGKTVIILDTMLATSGTINACADIISQHNPRQIVVASIMATEYGIEHCSPRIAGIITVEVSDNLDKNLYISPGVGDSGDRLYGQAEA